MASKVPETGGRDSGGRVPFIELSQEKGEAPFAVRRADDYPAGAESGQPHVDIWSWFGKHPVAVGVVTGVICFAMVSTAISLTVSSTEPSESAGPVADATASQPADNRAAFSSEGSAGINYSSDEAKRSRAGASGKNYDEATGTVGAGGQHATRPAIDFTTTDTSTAIGSAPWDTVRKATGSSTTSGDTDSADPTQLNSSSTSTIGDTSTTASTVSQTTATSGGSDSTGGSTTTTTEAATSTTDTTQPAVAFSIAAPGDQTLHPWEAPTDFAANLVSGATEYCWTFTQTGIDSTRDCSAGPTYQLPAYPDLVPGLVTVTAEATGPSETRSDTIQISLFRSTVFTQPQTGAVLTIGTDSLDIDVTRLFGTTSRCFRLTQTGYDSGELCYDESSVSFDRQHAIWDDLGPGPLTVQATIWGGGMVLSSDSVEVQLQ